MTVDDQIALAYTHTHPQRSNMIFPTPTWHVLFVPWRITLALQHHMGIYLDFHWHKNIKYGFKIANIPSVYLSHIPLQ